MKSNTNTTQTKEQARAKEIMAEFNTPEFAKIVEMAKELKLITAILQILLPMPIQQRDRVMRTVHVWLSPDTIERVILSQSR